MAGLEYIRSYSTALIKASKAASLPLGGVQDPLNDRIRLYITVL